MPDWRERERRGDVFTKVAPAAALPMFEAEAAGLAELRRAGEIRVPEVYAVETIKGEALIAMERLHFSAPSAADQAMLGRQLARLHRHRRDEYGWNRDNTVGPTPQINTYNADWAAFYRTQRLQYQLNLAERNGYRGELQALGANLCNSINDLFATYRPVASLLHGDLWGGNWGVADDAPVLFDPAVYYGDRETDLAMTRLFGGFSGRFYAAYESEWPLSDGHELRLSLYQLYHVLNHLNLFGRAYHPQALSLLRQLTRRI
jgi:fructosamine-3-kinase